MKNRKLLAIGLIAIIVVIGVAVSIFSSSPKGPQDDAIITAVFRYFMQQNPPIQSELYCLSVNGKDPSDTVIFQLKNNNLVKKSSDCITARNNGKWTAPVSITKFSVIQNEARAKLVAIYTVGAGGTFDYELKYLIGQWFVIGVSETYLK